MQEEEQKALLEKLRADSKRTKGRLAKMEEEQTKVKFPVKDELLESLIAASVTSAAAPSTKKSATVELVARKEIPAAFLQLSTMLPENTIDDAVLVWDFLNVFRCVLFFVYEICRSNLSLTMPSCLIPQQNVINQRNLLGRLC